MILRTCSALIGLKTLLLLAANVWAQEAEPEPAAQPSAQQNTNSGVIVLSDTVTGNQEQPKVLYIVPWQGAGDDTMLKQELVTHLKNDVFAPVERAEHQRELEMINTLSSPGVE